ncbi:hypothetical protein VTK73DRAFT_5105 [Phialemonium thermophilum]|uniref:Uncharacterized protein n=1 Tax=Phialemonium thermophilum TaxID=223376 RepID=A0ABR3V3J0_9PEZI
MPAALYMVKGTLPTGHDESSSLLVLTQLLISWSAQRTEHHRREGSRRKDREWTVADCYISWQRRPYIIMSLK